MPDTYTSQFSGEEIDAALRAAQIISGADTPAALREKLEIRGDTIPVSATDPTPISEALTTSGGGINPNLLDNWYFGNPVNQRGQVEYTGTGYMVDRWIQGFDGTLTSTLTDDGIKIVARNDGTYKNFEQILPYVPTNTTFTMSFLVDNFASISQIYTGFSTAQFDIRDNLITWTFKTGGSISGVKTIGIQIKVGKTATIKAAKLELGDTQTLAHQDSSGNWVLNEIPDFGEQLRRCTYYAEKVETKDTPAITNSTFVPSGATSAVFILPYARKRTVPAINFNDVSNYRIIARSISGRTTAFSATAISLLDVSRTKAAILVSFNATDQGYYCFLQRSDNAPAGYAFISADL